MKKINCVLLVDDDSTNNYLNENLIRKMDIANSVAIVGNGPDALAFIREYTSSDNRCPELIIMDLNGSRIDNVGFIDAFRELFYNSLNVKIIILTSSQDDGEFTKLRALGVTHFIEKPLSAEKLLQAFRQYLQ